jgi:hypothetical protein
VSLAAPTDGTASRLLPVVVEPSTGLAHGQTVRISGSGFSPGASLGAVLCSAGAAGGGGVAFCELAFYDNFSASAEGHFTDDYLVRRFITTPSEGRVDCAASTDRCLLAVGNVSDYDESGGSFISYDGAPHPPPPALRISPSSGLTDGQVISVRGTGVRAAPDGWLRQCPAGALDAPVCRRLDAVPEGPAVGGELSVRVTVARVLGTAAGSVDCTVAPGCVLATTEYAGRTASLPLDFAPVEVPTTTSTTTSTVLPPPPSTWTTEATTTSTTSE